MRYYDSFWMFMFYENYGNECKWLAGLAEIGMSNEHIRAYGTIKVAT